MTDETKGLLDLAAKAMGLNVVRYNDSGWAQINYPAGQYWWNPLESAVDNEEMECQLEIDTQFLDGGCRASHDPERGKYTTHYASYQRHNNNRITARRWASLRVAAELGRMKEKGNANN